MGDSQTAAKANYFAASTARVSKRRFPSLNPISSQLHGTVADEVQADFPRWSGSLESVKVWDSEADRVSPVGLRRARKPSQCPRVSKG
jgi:hypothetical protein